MHRLFNNFVILSLCIIFLFRTVEQTLDKYEYMLKRNEIKKFQENRQQTIFNERKFFINNKTYKENIVDLYFQFLKKNEIKRQKYRFYYPMEANPVSIRNSSSLYKFLRILPKGQISNCFKCLFSHLKVLNYFRC